MPNRTYSPLLATLFLLALFTVLPGYGQRPTIDDFTISGDTYRTADDCFRLTEERNYSSGSIWYKRPVSLSAPFSIELSIMAGCKDEEGADGMVFVFTSQANRVGYVGEGIGFAGLRPSLGIEIDTWRNYHLNDPAEDHLAVLVNGQVGHFGNNLAGPVLIPNIEDCRRHKFAVRWNPDNQQLRIEIDNEPVITLQHNLINGVFQGNDTVYWGVTAATGRYNNFHEVCFDRLSYAPKPTPLPLEPAALRPIRAGW